MMAETISMGSAAMFRELKGAAVIAAEHQMQAAIKCLSASPPFLVVVFGLTLTLPNGSDGNKS